MRGDKSGLGLTTGLDQKMSLMLPDVRNVRYSLSLTDQVAGRQEGKTPMKLILQNNLCAYEYIGESSRYMFHFRIYFLSLNHHMAHF